MMPNIKTTPIMDYVRWMENRVRELLAEREANERPVFVWGFIWGAGTGAVAVSALWLLLRRAGAF